MKTSLIAATLVVLGGASAFAAELPSQDPFRHFGPGSSVTVPGSFTDEGSAAYPDSQNFPSFVPSTAQLVPGQSSEGPVQTYNSLPPGN